MNAVLTPLSRAPSRFGGVIAASLAAQWLTPVQPENLTIGRELSRFGGNVYSSLAALWPTPVAPARVFSAASEKRLFFTT